MIIVPAQFGRRVRGIDGLPIFAFALAGMFVLHAAPAGAFDTGEKRMTETIALPPARMAGTMSFEEALQKRHSVRDFLKAPISLAEVSQLLWAAQGTTHGDGLRTAPSGGALYPLELYLMAGNVSDLPAGIYRYVSRQHRLEPVRSGAFEPAVIAAARQQEWLQDSAVILALAAVESRTTGKYGARGVRYIHMEAGHAAQNVLLQAVTLGLAGTPVGAFDDEAAGQALGLPEEERILYLLPIGRPR